MPDGKVFGTFFIAHTKTNSLPDESEKLLRQFKQIIESNLASLLQAPKTNTKKFMTAITKQEKTGKMLKEYRNRIEELERSNQRLKISMEGLKRSNRDLEEFAFLASHDLQEPLRKIRTLSTFIKSHSENLDEKCKDYFSRMIKASARMQSFIDDLLQLARVTGQTRQPQKTDLNNLLQDVLVDLEDRITSTCAEIQIGKLPVLSADAIQTKQLFQNLLSNSLKFHQKGVAPVIKVSSQLSSSGNMEIVVEDNGIGIRPEHKERIFKPFERLHGRDEYEGSGMGLAMCQKIVSLHGWEIEVEGIPDQGTKVLISIPSEQT
jgi:light-regulated signal transduction histidine kinase (bacteriophytochrome)